MTVDTHDTLMKGVKTWGTQRKNVGKKGLDWAVRAIEHMANGSRDWDIIATMLSYTVAVAADDKKKADVANRSLRLLLAAYFGSKALTIKQVKRTGNGSHPSGFRITFNEGYVPAGEITKPIGNGNKWAWVKLAVQDGRSLDNAAFLADLRSEVVGLEKTAKPYDYEKAAGSLARKLVKEHVNAGHFISALRKALTEAQTALATAA